jgi:pilus assembly protein FimV
MAHRSLTVLSALLVASATTAGHAAELGEAQVLSHIGQALVADVELTLIEDPAAKVAVRLANPDVYRGANIAMPPVLSSLNMTVMRRDGRQFLHLTSLKPVERRILHVYLELVDGGQRSVRLVTLWLTPDPNPAPAPAPAPAPLPVREPVAAPVVAAPVPVPRPAAALHTGEEYVDVARPAAPAARKLPVKPVSRPAPVRKPAPAAAPADAPACAARAPSEHLNACVALGEKNAALHHQLGKLEEKVKVLQGAAPVAIPAAVPAPTPAPAAKGAPRIHRKPKKVEPPEAQTPWLLIGAIGAVLVLGALALAVLRRRKRAGFGKIPAEHKPAKIPKTGEGEPKPHFMAAVKARLMPGKKEAAPAVERVAEQAE